MSRFKRIYYGNSVYHVFFRGNNRQNILKFKSDKEDLLRSIGKHQERKSFIIYGFALMDNHAHLILEANEKCNISNIMQAILLSFSVKYRRKYDYVGHVWQGRFQSKPIVEDRYIHDCLNYVHHNPVKAGMAMEECGYLYSSARFYQGLKSKGVYEHIQLMRYGDTSIRTPYIPMGYLETVQD